MKYIEEKSRSGIIHKKFTSAFGKKILEKFGWKEGEGLGKNKSGITDVIQVKRREENKGEELSNRTNHHDKANNEREDESYDSCFEIKIRTHRRIGSNTRDLSNKVFHSIIFN